MKIINTKDHQLEKKLMDRLNWDARVSISDMRLVVKNGIVSLFGYFDKTYRQEAALKVLSNTQGVLGIQDKSCVLTDYHRTDSEIETILLKRIVDLPFLKGEWIDVSVRHGVVKFEGVVYKSRIKAFCAKMAWEMSGVKDCHNLIELGTQPQSASVAARVQLPQLKVVESVI